MTTIVPMKHFGRSSRRLSTDEVGKDALTLNSGAADISMAPYLSWVEA